MPREAKKVTTSEPMRPEEPVTRSFTRESYGGLGEFRKAESGRGRKIGYWGLGGEMALLRSVSVNLAELGPLGPAPAHS